MAQTAFPIGFWNIIEATRLGSEAVGGLGGFRHDAHHDRRLYAGSGSGRLPQNSRRLPGKEYTGHPARIGGCCLRTFAAATMKTTSGRLFGTSAIIRRCTASIWATSHRGSRPPTLSRRCGSSGGFARKRRRISTCCPGTATHTAVWRHAWPFRPITSSIS